MPAEGTSKIPVWMSNKIKQIAYDFNRVNDTRATWLQVQVLLTAWMHRTPAEFGSNQTLWDLYKDNLPKRAAIQSRIAQASSLKSIDDPIEDAPWTFSMSSRYGFSDESSGELFALWKFSMGFSDVAPFTVRVARWANRLRFITEAGGSREGLVKFFPVLLEFAASYAAYEKAALLVTESRGQTGITAADSLDAQLMYREEPAVLQLALELGAFKGIGPENWITELNNENPVIGNQLEDTLDRLNERIEEAKSLDTWTERIQESFPDKVTARNFIDRLATLGVLKFRRVYKAREKEFHGIKKDFPSTIIWTAMLLDIVETMERDTKDGTTYINVWQPPIEYLLDSYYDRV